MSSETRHDLLSEGLARRFAATLDRDVDRSPAQGIHWCLCLPDGPTATLGADGHPPRGSFMPESPLERRMWAASDVVFHAPIAVGATIERRSAVAGTEVKSGSTGALMFVTVDHETLADGVLAVSERQTIVYRGPGQAPLPDGPGAPDPALWPWRRAVTPSAALLFRYSALTFNTHRIHYDHGWATAAEGYPALVVHGPLTATLLLDLADRMLGPDRLASFSLRALSPAFVDLPLVLLGRPEADRILLEAQTADGRRVMSATAVQSR